MSDPPAGTAGRSYRAVSADRQRGWYVPRALGESAKSAATPWSHRPARGLLGTLALFVAATALSACGGGQRQDVTEPVGNFPVQVTQAKFPARQQLSETTDLQLAIKNAGDKTVPDLAITIFTGTGPHPSADGSFNARIDDPALANPSRPVWILENDYPKILVPGVSLNKLDSQPTAGAAAAQTDTFQFGPLAPGDEKAIDWRVTPAKSGTYTVQYQVAAGLQGNAKAVTNDGAPVKGQFTVTISSKPPQTCVTGSGQVVQGRCQLGPTG